MTFSDIFATFRWWTVVMVVGILATPLTLLVLKRLPERGYAFVKLIGLLVVGYVFWLLGSLGFLDNSLGGILVALMVLGGLSFWSYRRLKAEDADGQPVIPWIKEHWRYILIAELVFVLVFAVWTWVRAQNPTIMGTEKPMEFAFLNSLDRSPDFPPLDPWMSGFAISYYYFGYVIASVITRLAAVPEAVGFNLAVAWLTAASALGAFGLVFNLISSSRQAIRRSAIVFAIIAAVALPIAGNLEIAAEVLYANGIGSPETWEWLDIRDLNDPANAPLEPRYESSQWWWWRSSRVIHEYSISGREETGLEPIAEFPGFSFVLGDLHSHVLSLPFAFLSIAAALSWWLNPGSEGIDVKRLSKLRSFRSAKEYLSSNNGSLLLFTILLLGGLSFLNTWDVLIHMFIVVASFMLALWRRAGQWHKRILRQGISLALVLVIGSLIVYLPFYLGFRSQAGPPFLLPMIMRPTRLMHFLAIFGMSMIGVTALMLTLLVRGVRTPSHSGRGRYWARSVGITLLILVALIVLMSVLGLVAAASDEGLNTVLSLADDLGINLPDLPQDPSVMPRLSWSFGTVAKILPSLFVARIPHSVLIVVLLSAIIVAIYLLTRLLDRNFDPLDEQMEPEIDDSAETVSESSEENSLTLEPDIGPGILSLPAVLPFVLLLIFTAILLVLGPEFVYLKDNFGQRINTIFKFYYQAWVLFGVAALFGIDYLLRNFKIVGIFAGGAYAVALLASLLFPYYAIQSRAVEYRGAVASEEREPATLNGLSYIGKYNPDELEAIEWLQANVDGTPVILEAVGGQYTNFGRVSASTGLPTLLGWAGHEYQWRGSTPEPALRGSAVEIIYNGLDWDQTLEFLNSYDVAYIYFGANERNTYGTRSEEIFDRNLDLAYQNNSVKIYRWTPYT